MYLNVLQRPVEGKMGAIFITSWTLVMLQLQTIKAIVNSCSFKSLKPDEPRRVQVLDLYCLTRFESESSSREIVLLKTSWRIVYKTIHYIYYTNVAAL